LCKFVANLCAMIIKTNALIPNSYNLEAQAEILILPETKEDFKDIFTRYQAHKIIVLGRGNNIILSQPYYDHEYVFVILRENFGNFIFTNEQVIVEAGADMKILSIEAQKRGLSGLEYFYGIPSSLGGAIYMNAGANEFETKQIVKTVTYFDKNTKEIHTLNNEDSKFSYRHSIFQDIDAIILEASLLLTPSSKEKIWNKMISIYRERDKKQPLDYPSAGSVFKRPQGFYVGKMIEDLGLKGYSIGGAKISEKHAGFIINYNKATGKDILQLINLIREKVHKHYGVWLETEQIII